MYVSEEAIHVFAYVSVSLIIIISRTVGQRLMFYDGLFFFSKNSPNLANRFQPNFRETSETVVVRVCPARFLNFCLWGSGGLKNTPKSENSDIGVQSFGHNSETNQDIKNRNNSLTSSINSKITIHTCSWTYLTLTFIGWRVWATLLISVIWTSITL